MDDDEETLRVARQKRLSAMATLAEAMNSLERVAPQAAAAVTTHSSTSSGASSAVAADAGRSENTITVRDALDRARQTLDAAAPPLVRAPTNEFPDSATVISPAPARASSSHTFQAQQEQRQQQQQLQQQLQQQQQQQQQQWHEPASPVTPEEHRQMAVPTGDWTDAAADESSSTDGDSSDGESSSGETGSTEDSTNASSSKPQATTDSAAIGEGEYVTSSNNDGVYSDGDVGHQEYGEVEGGDGAHIEAPPLEQESAEPPEGGAAKEHTLTWDNSIGGDGSSFASAGSPFAVRGGSGGGQHDTSMNGGVDVSGHDSELVTTLSPVGRSEEHMSAGGGMMAPSRMVTVDHNVELQRERDQAVQSLTKCRLQIQEMRERGEAKDHEIERLQQLVAHNEQSKQKMQNFFRDTMSKVREGMRHQVELQRRNAHLEKEVNRLVTQIGPLQRFSHGLEEDLSTKVEENRKLRRNMDRLHKRVRAAETNSFDLARKVTAIEAELRISNRALLKSMKEVETLKKARAAREAAAATASTSNASASSSAPASTSARGATKTGSPAVAGSRPPAVSIDATGSEGASSTPGSSARKRGRHHARQETFSWRQRSLSMDRGDDEEEYGFMGPPRDSPRTKKKPAEARSRSVGRSPQRRSPASSAAAHNPKRSASKSPASRTSRRPMSSSSAAASASPLSSATTAPNRSKQGGAAKPAGGTFVSSRTDTGSVYTNKQAKQSHKDDMSKFDNILSMTEQRMSILARSRTPTPTSEASSSAPTGPDAGPPVTQRPASADAPSTEMSDTQSVVSVSDASDVEDATTGTTSASVASKKKKKKRKKHHHRPHRSEDTQATSGVVDARDSERRAPVSVDTSRHQSQQRQGSDEDNFVEEDSLADAAEARASTGEPFQALESRSSSTTATSPAKRSASPAERDRQSPASDLGEPEEGRESAIEALMREHAELEALLAEDADLLPTSSSSAASKPSTEPPPPQVSDEPASSTSASAAAVTSEKPSVSAPDPAPAPALAPSRSPTSGTRNARASTPVGTEDSKDGAPSSTTVLTPTAAAPDRSGASQSPMAPSEASNAAPRDSPTAARSRAVSGSAFSVAESSVGLSEVSLGTGLAPTESSAASDAGSEDTDLDESGVVEDAVDHEASWEGNVAEDDHVDVEGSFLDETVDSIDPESLASTSVVVQRTSSVDSERSVHFKTSDTPASLASVDSQDIAGRQHNRPSAGSASEANTVMSQPSEASTDLKSGGDDDAHDVVGGDVEDDDVGRQRGGSTGGSGGAVDHEQVTKALSRLDSDAVEESPQPAAATTSSGETAGMAMDQEDPESALDEEEREHMKNIQARNEFISYLTTSGITLLKHGRRGKPHYRVVRLSEDHTELYWTDPDKPKPWRKVPKKSRIALNSLSLLVGKTTTVLQRSSVSAERCFSLFGDTAGSRESLDLECKNENDRDHFVACFRLLIEYAD